MMPLAGAFAGKFPDLLPVGGLELAEAPLNVLDQRRDLGSRPGMSRLQPRRADSPRPMTWKNSASARIALSLARLSVSIAKDVHCDRRKLRTYRNNFAVGKEFVIDRLAADRLEIKRRIEQGTVALSKSTFAATKLCSFELTVSVDKHTAFGVTENTKRSAYETREE